MDKVYRMSLLEQLFVYETYMERIFGPRRKCLIFRLDTLQPDGMNISFTAFKS